MRVTTSGSDFWPLTPEGRVLALLLSIFGLAIFGHIAASLATCFIGQQTAVPDSDVAGIASVGLEVSVIASGGPADRRLAARILFSAFSFGQRDGGAGL